MVSAKAQATRLPVLGLRTDADTQFVFLDLPGLLDPSYLLQQRMRALAVRGLEQADVILHLHPAPEAPAPSLMELAALDRPPRAPIVPVYTKSDTVALEVARELEERALVVSARTGHGIDHLLEKVRSLLPQGEFRYPVDDLGTQPLRFFVVEYLREAAFELLEDELPYSLTAEVEEFRESSDPIYIRATLFVERDSQKRILIGAKGKTIKAIGQHARARLEALLGSRVFLETWVKVLPRWRQNAEALARFGFPDLNSGEIR